MTMRTTDKIITLKGIDRELTPC